MAAELLACPKEWRKADGFYRLEPSSERDVYRAYDGNVYKVGTDINLNEFHNYVTWCNQLPRPFMLPRMSLHAVGPEAVLCAEYIEGRTDEDYLYKDECVRLQMHTGLIDVWGENIIPKGDILYIVDIEC